MKCNVMLVSKSCLVKHDSHTLSVNEQNIKVYKENAIKMNKKH